MIQTRYAIFLVCGGGAIIYDAFFGTKHYPVLTIILCGIVVIYEFVSPNIYRPY
jgi:hypothetical protein